MNAHISELNMEVDVDVGLEENSAEEKLIVTGDEAITQGSLWLAIWTLSWPLFLNMVTIAFASFADIWVEIGRAHV